MRCRSPRELAALDECRPYLFQRSPFFVPARLGDKHVFKVFPEHRRNGTVPPFPRNRYAASDEASRRGALSVPCATLGRRRVGSQVLRSGSESHDVPESAFSMAVRKSALIR